MKRFILILLLFLTLSTYAETFFEPEWSEFCPKKYSNVSADRWHYTSSGRYWSERRKNFEKRLEKCNTLTPEYREACYKNLREIENNATKIYSSERTGNALKYMMINSMF